MRLLLFPLLLWALTHGVQCQNSTSAKNQTEISKPKTTAPARPVRATMIETAPLVPRNGNSRRSKRQQDSSTAFVGLSIQKGAQSEDYARVKAVAGRVRRSSGRRRRAIRITSAPQWTEFDEYMWANSRPRKQSPFGFFIRKGYRGRKWRKPKVVHQHHHHKIFVPVQVQKAPPTTPAPRLLTRTQETFNVINRSPTLSRNLREEYNREFNTTVVTTSLSNGQIVDPVRVEAANRLIVVRETGVTCNDVCDRFQGDSLGYGTIGICTPKFCQCDFNLAQYTRFDCPPDMVFDPILLACNSPFNVVLCNDEEFVEAVPVKTNYIKVLQPAVVAVPKVVLSSPPVLATAGAPTVAPVVVPQSHQYHSTLLTNSLGASGFQNVVTPSSLYVTPTTPLSTIASPVSTAVTPTVSTQYVGGKPVQISQLSPSELQAVSQLGRQVLPSEQYTILQNLVNSQLNLQHSPAQTQLSYGAQHGTPASVSKVEKQRNYSQVQAVTSVVSTPQPVQQVVVQQQQPIQTVTFQQPYVLAPQLVNPAAITVLSQTGLLSSMMHLTPYQMTQLAEAVRLLASTNRFSGSAVSTTAQPAKQGYN